jgi:hypothetical protein
VVVDNLDLVRVTIAPNKADAVLIIDPNTVLPLAISSEFFETIARENT